MSKKIKPNKEKKTVEAVVAPVEPETVIDPVEVIDEPVEMVGKGAVSVLIGNGPRDSEFGNALSLALGKLGYRTVSTFSDVKAVITVSAKFENIGYKLTVGDKKGSIDLANKIEEQLLKTVGLGKFETRNVGNIGKVGAMIGFDYNFFQGSTSEEKSKKAMKIVAEIIAKAVDTEL